MPACGASSTALSAARSSLAGICKAVVSDSGPPDWARSITCSPTTSPKRDSWPPPTVKYANPTLSPSTTSTVPPVASWHDVGSANVAQCRSWSRPLAGTHWPRSGASGPALAPGATLQAFQDVGQSLVALSVHEVEIYPRIGKRAPETKDQGELWWGEVVAVFHQRGGQIISSFVAECRVRHDLLGEPLQHIDTNRTILGRYHRIIVLAYRCYCLNDRDCTSPATGAAYVHRGGASITMQTT